MHKLIVFLTFFGLFLHADSGSAFSSGEAVEVVAIGKKLLEQGKTEAAISEFEKAAMLDPRYGAAQLNLGYAFERANRVDEAMEAYRKAIEIEPRNFYAHNNLGVLYDKKGTYDRAIAEFLEALKVDSANTTALKNLETARKNKTALLERNAVIEKAVREVVAKPNDPVPAYQLARIYANYGRKEAAIEWLDKAVGLGFKDFAYLKTDPAFTAMREEREFQLLLLRK